MADPVTDPQAEHSHCSHPRRGRHALGDQWRPVRDRCQVHLP